MNAETFFESFDLLAEAPNSVAKLRELILHLAVRGALVPQDPKDESAEMLVSKIDAERKRLVKAGTLSNSATIPRSNETSYPYPLPNGWSWVRLGELGGFIGGGTPSKERSEFWDGDIPWVSPKDMKRPYIRDAIDHVSLIGIEESSAKLIPANSLLFVVRGMILAHSFPVALTEREVTINQDMKALCLARKDIREYLLRCCQANRDRVLANVERSSHGTCRIPTDIVANFLIPLPPLAEQRRIVSKVDELLGLCDELETRQGARRELRERLVQAALDQLLASRDPADFATHWQRLQCHFDILFDTPSTVPQLRHAIIQLAVEGKLVRQSPTEEPARQLLMKIKEEREQLIAERQIPKSEPAPSVDESHTLFLIPETWRWVRLSDVCHVITDGDHLTPEYAESGIAMLSAKHVGSHSLLLEDIKWVSPETAARSWARCCPDERDILVVSRGGGVGRTIISGRRNYCLMGSVLLFKPASNVDERFLYYFLNSKQGNEKLRTTSGASAQQAIYITHLKRNFVVPLPPLAEQRRIVAKATELLSLCDALESRLTLQESSSSQLLQLALHNLTVPETAKSGILI